MSAPTDEKRFFSFFPKNDDSTSPDKKESSPRKKSFIFGLRQSFSSSSDSRTSSPNRSLKSGSSSPLYPLPDEVSQAKFEPISLETLQEKLRSVETRLIEEDIKTTPQADEMFAMEDVGEKEKAMDRHKLEEKARRIAAFIRSEGALTDEFSTRFRTAYEILLSPRNELTKTLAERKKAMLRLVELSEAVYKSYSLYVTRGIADNRLANFVNTIKQYLKNASIKPLIKEILGEKKKSILSYLKKCSELEKDIEWMKAIVTRLEHRYEVQRCLPAISAQCWSEVEKEEVVCKAVYAAPKTENLYPMSLLGTVIPKKNIAESLYPGSCNGPRAIIIAEKLWKFKPEWMIVTKENVYGFFLELLELVYQAGLEPVMEKNDRALFAENITKCYFSEKEDSNLHVAAEALWRFLARASEKRWSSIDQLLQKKWVPGLFESPYMTKMIEGDEYIKFFPQARKVIRAKKYLTTLTPPEEAIAEWIFEAEIIPGPSTEKIFLRLPSQDIKNPEHSPRLVGYVMEKR